MQQVTLTVMDNKNKEVDVTLSIGETINFIDYADEQVSLTIASFEVESYMGWAFGDEPAEMIDEIHANFMPGGKYKQLSTKSLAIAKARA